MRYTNIVTSIIKYQEKILLLKRSNKVKTMKNVWSFKAQEENCCQIEFDVEFEFRSLFLNRVMGLFFYDAVKRMVGCFEQRARIKYGSPYDFSHLNS